MRITRRGEYAINGLLYFAKRGEGRVVFVREVSGALDIPESFLAKIFQAFVRRGILVSRRGAYGGYALARPADAITLREAIEAAQGPLALNACLKGEKGQCGRHSRCGLHRVLGNAQRKMEDYLEGVTIRALADSTRFRDVAPERVTG